jgi:hypothetical protein
MIYQTGKLPLLKLWIFPIIFSHVNFFVTGVANGFYIVHRVMCSIFIKMMCNKVFSLGCCFSRSTYFTNNTSVLVTHEVTHTPLPVSVVFSKFVNHCIKSFSIYSTDVRSRLASVRAVFVGSASPNLISFRSKFFFTLETLKHKLGSIFSNKIVLSHCVFISKSSIFHNSIIPRSTKDIQ